MALYHYRAVKDDGEVQLGQLEADSEQAVLEQLRLRNLIPIEVSTRRNWQALLNVEFGSLLRHSRQGRLTLRFTQYLSSLLQAGVPLDRSLEIMHKVNRDPAMQALVKQIRDGVHRGQSLSRVIGEERQVFGGFYVSMVQAAEMSGDLASGLHNLSYYLERSKSLRDKLVSALIYPMILLAVAMLSLLIILTYVIPQFSQLFADMGAKLPLSTQIVIGVANGLQAYAGWAVVVLVVLAWWGQRTLQRPEYRLAWDRWRLRLPLLGGLYQRIETARFSRSLGTLLKGGVPLLAGLEISRQVVGNRVMAEQIGVAAESLKQGRLLAPPLLATGLFPDLAMQMIQVGEETGRLDEMLLKVADTYDLEVETAMQRSLAVLEPLLIVGLGVLIAGIVMSVLVAVMSLNELPI
ncbi:type II secretion system F family protein [Pseudomonas sp. L-22-4S-12]|uniref:type II secretion system F family protein n=1 Tax=Pseudomonas sp. L-22-4S-12 TaxID=2610893 RepID=UPI00132A8449|nr:type II secretion system F family protein [Pseudomonas sp. L-22-4S-12]MWV14699.1 type II secretion system F family protein [Pseudomonas sp. L-22-4S-12]